MDNTELQARREFRRAALTELRKAYLELVTGQVQSYAIGSRNLTKFDLKTLKAEIDRQALNVKIEIDGGVCPDNAPKLIAAGADILVAGSAVFNSDNPAEVINSLKC